MQAPQFRIKARRAARGFTMAELMVTVAIVGILATIATYSVRKYVATSKSSEAIEMIGNIKAAQEAYKGETFSYLNVSSGLTADTSFYPANPTPGRAKMNFAGAGDGQANWGILAVQASGPVTYIYATTAGANSAPTALGSDITVGNWPATYGAPWYVVKARADFRGDGVYTVFATASFTGELYSANN